MSNLDRTTDDQPARKFFRPKGSVVFGWHPDKTWDISLKLRRRVGQISFFDFLAQPNLTVDRENVQVRMDRGESVSTLEIEVEIPNSAGMLLAAAS